MFITAVCTGTGLGKHVYQVTHTKVYTLYTKTFHFFINFVNVELVYRVICQ